MAGHTSVLGVAWSVLAAALLSVCVFARPEKTLDSPCTVLDSGWVCGVWRATGNQSFASFLGVPYAKQPLAELRFQELQPVESWNYYYQATQEGPICPQKDLFYGRIMQPKNTTLTEACIYANIHVPLDVLPKLRKERPPRELHPPYKVVEDEDETGKNSGAPIFVFIHGGGFSFGSGDTDLYGPEYLVSQGVIVVTFNYRLNVFGFLSLNNPYIPGNNGLRDIITLLNWVKMNAKAFGGNPNDITLGGQSAGAASAHLLTLSKAASGLFRRTILMSGTALPTFYTTTPSYAQFVSQMFLKGLGINSTDPEEVYRQLIDMRLEKIMQVHEAMQDQFGLTVFFPVVELSPLPNFTTILDDDPEALLDKGRGKDIPLLVGFTNAECYGFQPRFEQIDILARIKVDPIIMSPLHLTFQRSGEVSLDIAREVEARYFYGEPTMDHYVKSCSEGNFIYPAIKVARNRARVGGAPVFLYEFSYDSEFSIMKEVNKINYTGAAHLEDMTYVFRVNSILGPEDTFKYNSKDEHMKNWMVQIVTNFIRSSDPTGEREQSISSPWPAFTKLEMKYQQINMPTYRTSGLDRKQLGILRFFESLQNKTS